MMIKKQTSVRIKYWQVGIYPRYILIGCRKFTEKRWDEIMMALDACIKGTEKYVLLKIPCSSTHNHFRIRVTHRYIVTNKGLSRANNDGTSRGRGFMEFIVSNKIAEITTSELRQIDKAWVRPTKK